MRLRDIFDTGNMVISQRALGSGSSQALGVIIYSQSRQSRHGRINNYQITGSTYSQLRPCSTSCQRSTYRVYRLIYTIKHLGSTTHL